MGGALFLSAGRRLCLPRSDFDATIDRVMNAREADAEDVYVRRDSEGVIVSVSRVPAPGYDERCAATHPDIAAFIHAIAPAGAALAASDLGFIRVIEDLIDVLIEKEVLRLTDLPENAQAKLVSRRHMRTSLRSLSLLGDSDDTF